jgi:hypothetical protein
MLASKVKDIDVALVEMEAVPGERDLFRGGFSPVTCPPSQLAARRARFWRDRGGQETEALRRLREDLDVLSYQRRDSYTENLKLFRHTDVTTKQSIETFVEHGRFFHREDLVGAPFTDDYLALAVSDLYERAAHLRNIVSDLVDYPNYEVILVDSDELSALGGSGWAVKCLGNRPERAFFESIRSRERTTTPEKVIAQSYAAWQITQLPLIDQIHRYARAECDRLREDSISRKDVISFLNEKIAELDDRVAAER